MKKVKNLICAIITVVAIIVGSTGGQLLLSLVSPVFAYIITAVSFVALIAYLFWGFYRRD